MATALRTLMPTLLSLAFPLILRTCHLTLEPYTLFIPIGILALVWEKGYRETLETLSPELSEHTGPFSHVGVCILAQIFVQNIPGWRGEALFWTIFARWAFGLCRRHRVGIREYKRTYCMRFQGLEARVQATLLATLMALVFMTRTLSAIQVVAIWLHFYHCVGSAIAVGAYFLSLCCEGRLASWK